MCKGLSIQYGRRPKSEEEDSRDAIKESQPVVLGQNVTGGGVDSKGIKKHDSLSQLSSFGRPSVH